MARICPRCGRETKETIRGLCPSCFAEVYGVARLPGIVEVEVCRYCGAVRLGHRWIPSGGTFEGAIERVLEWLSSRLEPVEPLEAARLRGYSLLSEPNWTTRLTLRLEGEGPGGVRVEGEAPLVVRLKPSICPRCTVQVSGEYQVLVQVRAPRRLRGRLMELVEEAVGAAGVEADTIEAVETRDGVDVYLTHRGAASRLISALRRIAPLRVSGPYREHVGVTSRGRRRTRDTYVARIEP